MKQVIPVVLSIANDKSWRVRWCLANRLHEIMIAVDESSSNGSFGTVFESLLNDSEPEVRPLLNA